ncbi:ABC transporter permease [Mycobacterium deserti]|uniref:Transport permease protein n=1 Tax=Mycobacterium deserti TaxID=2978347 RepID=A0ABT2M898_9MYCO|nr:ABC transporter permease [Mycobacterium deserti]MCT7657360.1 ABC transporter permease [Mycobacterium deserti]
MSAEQVGRNTLAFETVVFAGRQFTRWRRLPAVPIQSLLLPTLLLVTYSLMVSKSMTKLTGASGLHGLVPMCAVAGAMLGAIGAALAMPRERESGVFSRFWTLPVHRASALTGMLLAEAVRTLAATALITAVGFALGFRFEGSWLAIVPFMLMPVLVVVVFSAAVITVAMRPQGRILLTWLGTASIGLVFGSSGIAPLDIYPSWLRPLVSLQPMSPVIETMRALALGNPVTLPLFQALAWILGLGAVLLPLAVRGYRTAAENDR